MRHRGDFPFDSVTCACNTTHRVAYTTRKDLEHRAHVFVYDTHGVRRPRIPQARRNRTNLLLLAEPPAYIDFSFVSGGFHGLMSYHRHAAIHRPFHPASAVQDALARLHIAPSDRIDIGMWVDNCKSDFRAPVWQALNASGLAFASHGSCCNTRERSLGLSLHNSETARRRCRRHRLMVAVENHACPDWVSEHIYESVALCGAIPIVRTRRGQPDYTAAYGDLPLVDAGKRGWMNEVRKLMTSDDYYTSFLQRYVSAARRLRQDGSDRADGAARDFHCQFWDAKLNAAPPERVEWPPCSS